MNSSASSPFNAWRWPLTVLLLGVLLLLGYLASLRFVAQSAETVADGLRGIGQGFRSERITETFTAAIPQLASEKGGLLEVASLTAVETFTRSDEKRVLWDWVSLGRTVTEIEVPVTYRYQIRLREEWRMDVSGQTCVVYAPPPIPSLPPTIDTSEVRLEVDQGWLRFDSLQQTSELLKGLTPILSEQASQPQRLELVRERARRTTAEFVRDWLVREKQWGPESFRYVFVVFHDEKDEYPALIPAPTDPKE